MEKTAQQSLLDLLMDVVPSLKNIQLVLTPGNKNNKAADKLYEIWKDEHNRLANRNFRKPLNLSSSEFGLMESKGYIVEHGGNIKITNKGAKVLNEMILNNDKSIFASSASLVKTASVKKINNWYRRAISDNAIS